MPKEQAIAQLQKAVDALHNCDYRKGYIGDDVISDYLYLLRELSDAWANLVYRTAGWSDDQKRQLRLFSLWIHDYNAWLWPLSPENEDEVRTCVPYFESMLNVSHAFLDDYKEDRFKLDRFYTPPKGSGKELDPVSGVCWRWVTPEMCGIDSPVLPYYYPTLQPFCVDDEQIRAFFYKRFPDKNPEEMFQNWLEYNKPVLCWVNQHLVPKSSAGMKEAGLWLSIEPRIG